MLVLSRKAGERIRIGDDITIVVNRVVGSRVSVGIEAPPNVRIVRGELDFFDHDPPRKTNTTPEPQRPVPLALDHVPTKAGHVPATH
jgi:carbon storage regulator